MRGRKDCQEVAEVGADQYGLDHFLARNVQRLGNAISGVDRLVLKPSEGDMVVGQEVIESHEFALQRKVELLKGRAGDAVDVVSDPVPLGSIIDAAGEFCRQ